MLVVTRDVATSMKTHFYIDYPRNIIRVSWHASENALKFVYSNEEGRILSKFGWKPTEGLGNFGSKLMKSLYDCDAIESFNLPEDNSVLDKKPTDVMFRCESKLETPLNITNNAITNFKNNHKDVNEHHCGNLNVICEYCSVYTLWRS